MSSKNRPKLSVFDGYVEQFSFPEPPSAGTIGGMSRGLPQLKLAEKGRYQGRYIAYYRNQNGKSDVAAFTSDKRESEIQFQRWLLANYDNASMILGPIAQDDQTATRPNTMGVIAKAYGEHTTDRTREDKEPKRRGLIGQVEAYAIHSQTLSILAWAKTHFGDRFRTVPFQSLWTATDYEAMMLYFTKKYKKNAQINKHRQRFWALATFAATRFGQRVKFARDEVPKYGGDASRKEWSFPTPEEFRKILRKANEMERTWIWMALGLGFGPLDIAQARPICFDAEDYDMGRTKVQMHGSIPRFGKMRPMTGAWLSRWLKANPCKPHELLFVTPNGKPYTRSEAKTEEELRLGAGNHKPKKMTYKSCNILAHRWTKVVARSGVEWRGGFYILRHIACTAFANLPDITLAKLRTFMGHGDTQTVDKYLKHLTPAVKRTVEWVNEMLVKADPMAWDVEWQSSTDSCRKPDSVAGKGKKSSSRRARGKADDAADGDEQVQKGGDGKRRKPKHPAA